MKTKSLLSSILVFFCVTVSFSQQAYQRLHSISESDYSLKTELELDYNYTVNLIEESAHHQSCSLTFNSPGFLNFNKNDLLFFKAEPREFIETPLLIDIDCCFSDSKGQNDEVAGFTLIAEHVNIAEGDVKSEINLRGSQMSTVEVAFSLYDAEQKIKSGNKDYEFRLAFKHDECKSCDQKDVTGYIRYLDITISDDLRLDGRIINSVRFNDYLSEAFIGKNFADNKLKWAFEDRFTDNYYKDMPRIDAARLIDFLLNPKGIIEFSISGFTKSPDGAENITYKGSLKIYGDMIYKFWQGK